MDTRPERAELNDRLNLIETMIAEGRKTTESWGWTFVLWGAAYYIAIAWSTWGHSAYAWPTTMVLAALVTALVASRMGRKHAETTVGRALAAVWIGIGVSLFLFGMSEGWSGRLAVQSFVAAIAVMLGAANAISSIVLRWGAQFACALAWWAAAVASPFLSESQSEMVLLVAIFLCQIVFGVYMMLAEARERRIDAGKSGAAHV